MSQKKHIKLRLKQTGVFFFFLLNCLLVTASFVYSPSINSNPEHFQYPLQNQTGQESDKDGSFHFLNEQTDYSFARRNKQNAKPVIKTKNHLLDTQHITGKDEFKNFSSEYSPLIRPAYYSFLFLFNLF